MTGIDVLPDATSNQAEDDCLNKTTQSGIDEDTKESAPLVSSDDSDEEPDSVSLSESKKKAVEIQKKDKDILKRQLILKNQTIKQRETRNREQKVENSGRKQTVLPELLDEAALELVDEEIEVDIKGCENLFLMELTQRRYLVMVMMLMMLMEQEVKKNSLVTRMELDLK